MPMLGICSSKIFQFLDSNLKMLCPTNLNINRVIGHYQGLVVFEIGVPPFAHWLGVLVCLLGCEASSSLMHPALLSVVDLWTARTLKLPGRYVPTD